MLTTCTITIEEQYLSASDVPALVQKSFADTTKTCLVYEGISRAVVMELKDWDYPTAWEKDCLRLTVSNAAQEIRVEKNMGEDTFSVRIIQEEKLSPNAQVTYYKQEANLILRKTHAIATHIFAGGKGRIRTCEYFMADEDGMLTFYADRLCGTSYSGGKI